jgi:Holliday junction resolvase RusA-like endonuclease
MNEQPPRWMIVENCPTHTFIITRSFAELPILSPIMNPSNVKDTLADFTIPGGEARTTFNPSIDETDRADHPVKFFANPFYDKVFSMFLENPIRTNQSKSKIPKSSYKNLIRQMINEIELENCFPSRSYMLLNLHFKLPPDQFDKIDVDNMAKPLIDQMKGVLVVDDSQIVMLWVEKTKSSTWGCSVGIKFMSTRQQILPKLYFEEVELQEILSTQ